MNPAHREHPELHGLRGNSYARAWLRKRRVENIAAGRTWDGQERVRPFRMDLAGLSRNQRHGITNRERQQRIILAVV